MKFLPIILTGLLAMGSISFAQDANQNKQNRSEIKIKREPRPELNQGQFRGEFRGGPPEQFQGFRGGPPMVGGPRGPRGPMAGPMMGLHDMMVCPICRAKIDHLLMAHNKKHSNFKKLESPRGQSQHRN